MNKKTPHIIIITRVSRENTTADNELLELEIFSEVKLKNLVFGINEENDTYIINTDNKYNNLFTKNFSEVNYSILSSLIHDKIEKDCPIHFFIHFGGDDYRREFQF